MINWALKSQKNIIDMLKASKAKNRLSHAYLFTGEEGTEKLGVALYFAMMHYCDDVCLECKNCKNILELKHPNVYYIRPMGQNIKKEQIIALQQEFSKTSLTEGVRVYIIDEAEKLSLGAANSLLKFIEEPASQETYAILITNNQTAMISTILSRCQVINFTPVSKDVLIDELMNQGVSTDIARLLPNLTNSIEEAITIHKNPAFHEIVKLVINLGNNIANKKSSSFLYFKNYQGVFEDKESVSMLLKILLLYFLDTLVERDPIFISEEKTINRLREKKESMEEICKSIVKMQEDINYNVNYGLMIECFLLDIDGRF